MVWMSLKALVQIQERLEKDESSGSGSGEMKSAEEDESSVLFSL